MSVKRSLRRDWKIPAGIAAAVFVLLVGWIIWAWLARQATPSQTTVGSRLPESTPRAMPSHTAPRATAKVVEPAHTAQGAVPEICGLRPETTGDLDEVSQFVEGKTRAAYDRWEAALLNSSDLRARALGLIMRTKRALLSHALEI